MSELEGSMLDVVDGISSQSATTRRHHESEWRGKGYGQSRQSRIVRWRGMIVGRSGKIIKKRGKIGKRLSNLRNGFLVSRNVWYHYFATISISVVASFAIHILWQIINENEIISRPLPELIPIATILLAAFAFNLTVITLLPYIIVDSKIKTEAESVYSSRFEDKFVKEKSDIHSRLDENIKMIEYATIKLDQELSDRIRESEEQYEVKNNKLSKDLSRFISIDAHISRMIGINLMYNRRYLWGIGWSMRSNKRYGEYKKIEKEKSYDRFIDMNESNSYRCIKGLVDIGGGSYRRRGVIVNKVYKNIEDDMAKSDNEVVFRTIKDTIDYIYYWNKKGLLSNKNLMIIDSISTILIGYVYSRNDIYKVQNGDLSPYVRFDIDRYGASENQKRPSIDIVLEKREVDIYGEIKKINSMLEGF
ncbi:MAG: hypothetical protein AAGG50_04410 [Bacteroidota bacterium]